LKNEKELMILHKYYSKNLPETEEELIKGFLGWFEYRY